MDNSEKRNRYEQLTSGQRTDIAQAAKNGATAKRLATKYGVKLATIQRVLDDHAQRV